MSLTLVLMHCKLDIILKRYKTSKLLFFEKITEYLLDPINTYDLSNTVKLSVSTCKARNL